MAMEASEIQGPCAVDSSPKSENTSGRAVIDTSAPFESVKEAANRFGGMASWKPISHQRNKEIAGIVDLEDEAAQLERDLMKKERETLDVLKELELTKNVVEELKVKLQNEAVKVDVTLKENSNVNIGAQPPEEEKNLEGDKTVCRPNGINGLDLCPSDAPGFILLELKQAKLNLKRTTDDLADIRATVDLYKKKIEKENASLEKTRQRFSANTSKISSLEKELKETRKKQELMTRVSEGIGGFDDVSKDLQKLSSEMEQFKKVGETAKTEVVTATSKIEETKAKIRTAEIRLVAAKKMKEAARASEALVLMEIKALSKSEKKSSEDVTLTFDEYSSLLSKAREGEKLCKDRVVDAMVRVDEANVSKTEILKKVEEATEEVKVSKRALEEALSRVEAANKGKLAVEEALRIWRSEHGHKRRNLHSSTKFKNPHPSAHRRDARLLDVNGLNLVNGDEVKPVLKPTLSIGQILSQKLLLTEDYENGIRNEKIVGKRKVSLGQMLSKMNTDHPHPGKKSGKENKDAPWKRKKFSFGRISLLVTKQSKKKKSLAPRSM
ncbi:WEB family protein At2g38370-like [Andrographis paniculata]|uniref:WEB family protein At2g38370-like n=1 Tax=Andrographis paniculata TaxID=175694 RepID=UPI0021E7EFDA|nr:WEB family protein At2g38370-like [Andrographis paniculata]